MTSDLMIAYSIAAIILARIFIFRSRPENTPAKHALRNKLWAYTVKAPFWQAGVRIAENSVRVAQWRLPFPREFR
jgi:hypothetical protein